jgi:cytoskeletal protein RodZ
VDERETLGGYLKNQRESKKISLREVAKNTRVREYILKAIEEDRHDLLPAPTYVKGFLLAYAKYLNLDRKDILLRYERVLKGEPVKREPVPPSPTPSLKPKKKTSWLTKQTWVVGGVIVASFIVFYFFSPYSSKPPIEPVPEKPILKKKSTIAPSKPVTAITRTPEEKMTVEEKKPLTPSSSSTAAPSVQEKKPISLQLKAIEKTWVNYQADNQSEEDMIFKPGEGISVLASNQIRIVIGNAGGLDLILNGKVLNKYGMSGDVIKLIITPQGVEVKPLEKPKSP